MKDPLVLVLEPDERRRNAVVESIEESGFPAVGVATAEAASKAPLLSASVVVVSLLGGTGPLALLEGWREAPERADLPILALTAEGDARAPQEALEAGADDWSSWPVAPSLLHARIRAAERTGALRREVDGIGPLLASISRALEAREAYAIDHSRRVSELCLRAASAVGLSPSEAERTRRAALLHDIGLVAIPDELLHARRSLTAPELALVRAHPVVGYELLKSIPSLEPLASFVLGHHERIDGSGYPSGLTRGEIPLAVQLLGLADAYDALTSARPHRERRSHAAAVDTLREEARGGIWDEELVRAFTGAIAPVDAR